MISRIFRLALGAVVLFAGVTLGALAALLDDERLRRRHESEL